MGNSTSQNASGSEENECSVCYFVRLPRMQNRLVSDPIGSPMPDTPMSLRKKRFEAQSQVNQGGFLRSSRYPGLEKEASSGSQIEQRAEIYEGPEAEQALREKYSLEEVLGVGSTSTVHRCIDKLTRQQYACKVIDVHTIEERFQGMMEQFQTEIQALRDLQHPGIIRLFDVFLTGSKIYIVMEMMQGGELFDYVVEKGTLSELEAAKIVKKVTSALVYMHSKNIVHRDLKPENLLLKVKPPQNPSPLDIEVKIIDFGLSKAMEEPVARTFLGTRGYLAPEMLQRREYTRAVDAWALGVIVFVLVCGCLPFDDDSSIVPSDAMLQHKFTLKFPRWASNLSPSAKDLLHKLLDTNPSTRYSAEQALNHPWVQGGAAPKRNLLDSPGRIRASPALNPGSVRQRRSTRKCHPSISSPPIAPVTRKTSF